MTQVHQLWIGGDLSRFERLSASSFIHNGYEVNLWCYDTVGNLPAGVTIRDANEILPQESIFTVKGSPAPFVDLWRLTVLQRYGGLWADLDVIAVKPAAQLPQQPFLVTEDTWSGSWRSHLPWTITNCVIHNPLPQAGNIVHQALIHARVFPPEKIEWTTIGPELLHELYEADMSTGFAIQPVAFANAIPAGEIVERMLKPGIVNPLAHFVHLYNDMWRRAGIDKNTLEIPKHSVLGELFAKYY